MNREQSAKDLREGMEKGCFMVVCRINRACMHTRALLVSQNFHLFPLFRLCCFLLLFCFFLFLFFLFSPILTFWIHGELCSCLMLSFNLRKRLISLDDVSSVQKIPTSWLHFFTLDNVKYETCLFREDYATLGSYANQNISLQSKHSDMYYESHRNLNSPRQER